MTGQLNFPLEIPPRRTLTVPDFSAGSAAADSSIFSLLRTTSSTFSNVSGSVQQGHTTTKEVCCLCISSWCLLICQNVVHMSPNYTTITPKHFIWHWSRHWLKVPRSTWDQNWNYRSALSLLPRTQMLQMFIYVWGNYLWNIEYRLKPIYIGIGIH